MTVYSATKLRSETLKAASVVYLCVWVRLETQLLLRVAIFTVKKREQRSLTRTYVQFVILNK